MKSFTDRLNYAAQFCIRRAGSGNRASTRAFCDTIEWGDGEKLMSELVRRAHKNPKLADGVRLMFELGSINSAAAAFGVQPLPAVPAAAVDEEDTEVLGWFDVEAYSTKERWEGPDNNDYGLDGFKTLQAAIDYATEEAKPGGSMADFYEIVITAYGQHPNHDACERVWHLYDRPYAGDVMPTTTDGGQAVQQGA